MIAAARPGDVLIAVADSVGIHIPRGCMTGLCGACTCDMEDQAFPGNRGILRACSTLVCKPHASTHPQAHPRTELYHGKPRAQAGPDWARGQVSVPAGSDEMVVDLYRMLSKAGTAKPDPMARFEKVPFRSVSRSRPFAKPAQSRREAAGPRRNRRTAARVARALRDKRTPTNLALISSCGVYGRCCAPPPAREPRRRARPIITSSSQRGPATSSGGCFRKRSDANMYS